MTTTHHFIHPENEFRECPDVPDGVLREDDGYLEVTTYHTENCASCHGGGKIRTDAKPEIEVKAYSDLWSNGTLYGWREIVPEQHWAKGWGPLYPTKVLALAAARKELA